MRGIGCTGLRSSGDESSRNSRRVIADFRIAELTGKLRLLFCPICGRQLRAAADPKLNAQAEGEYRAALKENQYDEKSWCHLGEVIAARGDFKAAQEAYNKALSIQPTDSTARTDLAIALISMNQQKDAIPLLETAIKDDPTNTIAHYRLSALYRREGRTADAKHEMDEYTHYKNLKDKMSDVFKQVSLQTAAQ